MSYWDSVLFVLGNIGGWLFSPVVVLLVGMVVMVVLFIGAVHSFVESLWVRFAIFALAAPLALVLWLGLLNYLTANLISPLSWTTLG